MLNCYLYTISRPSVRRTAAASHRRGHWFESSVAHWPELLGFAGLGAASANGRAKPSIAVSASNLGRPGGTFQLFQLTQRVGGELYPFEFEIAQLARTNPAAFKLLVASRVQVLIGMRISLNSTMRSALENHGMSGHTCKPWMRSPTLREC